MKKIALGKGLRNLLNGTRVPGGPNGPFSSPEPRDLDLVSPGVGRLLRGEEANSGENQQEASPGPSVRRFWENWRTVKWLLLAADLVLFILALALVFKSTHRITFGEFLLCLLALTIGAALSSLAFLGNRGEDRGADEVNRER